MTQAPPDIAARTASDETRRFQSRAMASPLELTIVVGLDDRAGSVVEGAWSAVIDEFAASEAALSRFRETSEVSALNRAALCGEAVAVGRRLAVAAHACDRAHRLTGGRFDPRVIGQLDSWGYAGASLGAPVSTRAVRAPERIMERIDRRRIRLAHPIDLGGIGKGLAVRWATDQVIATGISRFLLDAGGDIATRGEAPEGGPWLVGIEDPDGGEVPLAVVALQDRAIATSSIRRLRWTANGQERHHLVDPSTGEPADGGLVAVTVAAADPAWAEVWSKALFIAGQRRIADEARARGLAAWWVDADRSLAMTPAARQQTTWVAGEA
jgi:thiamine biosynthesis lipoprotein